MHNIKDSALIKTNSYIDGQWHTSDIHFEVKNPATGSVIAQVSNGNADTVTLAIKAAKKAFKPWSSMPAHQRTALLRKWFDLMMQHHEDLARILTLEQGKPLAEAKAEIAYGAGFIEWFSEEAKRVYGDTMPSLSSSQKIIVIKQAVGVVAAITPWNFPNAMIARKAAAALAAGCSFVVRPAAQTPLSALAMAELAQRAGIPAGVFNVVVGTDANAIGQVLTTHIDVAKFTFTGSTAVGKKLIKQCASTIKKVSMELGGNAPFIVFNDADIDEAVQGAISSKYRNAGQTCVCTNRIFVQSDVLAHFTKKYTQAVNKLTVGDGIKNDTQIGPLISSAAVDGVEKLVAQAVEQGAVLTTGGKRHHAGSHFFQPTVLTQVTANMAITDTEIFAPVSPIIAFEHEEEVIAMANDTEYGLAAYFYARDIGRIWRVAQALEYGMVGINESTISNVAAPFGGIKQSGYGREGSKYGLDDYLDIKYLCMGGI
ncbi:MAG: NAD-dependent succinate-semialdehyde dehydrogenase [Cognaticolwellia sp.]